MIRLAPMILCLSALSPCVTTAWAGVSSKAIREAAEYILQRGGKEAAEMGVDSITKKIENMVAKYGDDAIEAVTKTGPKTFRVVQEAGENGGEVVKLLARRGNEAVWVVTKKDRMAIFIKYGDDAADAMIKHGDIAEPLIKSTGKPAAVAFKALSEQNGRRLAMMADDAALANLSRNDQLLGVIAKYGDKGMDFIWKNKGPLTIAATLTAFLANPKAFIDGAVSITETGVESVEKVATPITTGIAKGLNFNFFLPIVGLAIAGIATLKVWLNHRVVLTATRNDPNV